MSETGMKKLSLPGPQELHDAPPRVYFACHRDAIEDYLRLGYRIKEIWRACREADPPYPGCYTSFYRQVQRDGLDRHDDAARSAVPTASEAGTSTKRELRQPTAGIEYVRNNLRRNLPKLELE